LIGVTLLAVACGYVGWQAKIVRERKAWLNENEDRVFLIKIVDERYQITNMSGGADGKHRGYLDQPIANDPQCAIPWLRTLLGDQAIKLIGLPVEAPLGYRNRVQAMFPEADVMAIAPLDSVHQRFVAWPDELPATRHLYPTK
jgi:hypothetical protein